MSKFLITSALPYVNGVKHLGNLAGSLLPADIHARFRRQTGHDVLFLRGTDEHGTPVELAAHAAGVPVADYCARQHAVQADIYRRFGLSFDHFSRTSGEANRRLTQDIFPAASMRRASSRNARSCRPTRPPTGASCPIATSSGPARTAAIPTRAATSARTAPRCSTPRILRSPRSAISGATDVEFRADPPSVPETLGLRRPAARTGSRPAATGHRSSARSRCKWLDEGLRDRCITRDLEWGVPVPKRRLRGQGLLCVVRRPHRLHRRRDRVERGGAGAGLARLVAERRGRDLRAVPRQGQRALPRRRASPRRCWDRACRSSSSTPSRGSTG